MSGNPEPILDGLVDRYINRRFSPPLTSLFILLRFHPNGVTLLAISFGIVGCVFFLRGDYVHSVIGAVFFQLSALLDCCDGDVARRTGRVSAFGGWLDFLGDNLIHFLLFLSLAFVSPSLGLSAAAGIPLSVCAFLLARRTGGVARAAAYRLANRDFSLLLLVFAVFNRIDLFLIFAAIGVHVFWILLLGLTWYEVRRRLRAAASTGDREEPVGLH
jgi:phosphatidylglycerophosphate synthase